MMHRGYGWMGMGTGMWFWPVIGVLEVVLLVIIIIKVSKK